jgi:hypothetical protein
MHALAGGRAAVGYAAYRAIVRRLPPLWPILPLLPLPPVASLGQRIYRHIADSRACAIPARGGTAPHARSASLRPAIAVAALLLAGNVVCGAGEVVLGWPFACYPTFSAIRGAERTVLAIEVIDGEGRARDADAAAVRERARSPRVVGMLAQILLAPVGAEREAKLHAYWDLLVELSPDGMAGAVAVRCYRDRISVRPEDHDAEPLARELLFEFTPRGAALPPAGSP